MNKRTVVKECIAVNGPALAVILDFQDDKIVGIRLSKKKDIKKGKIPLAYQKAAGQIKSYLLGKIVKWDLALDEKALTSFQKKVFHELMKVPYGRTITYEELAIRVKNKNYRRAVAMALSANPFPVVIPCHRVVAKNGLGGFSGGIGIKKILLKLEGCKAVLEDQKTSVKSTAI